MSRFSQAEQIYNSTNESFLTHVQAPLGYKEQRVFSIYKNPTKFDLKEIKDDDIDSRGSYFGVRFGVLKTGAFYAWSSNLSHSTCSRLIGLSFYNKITYEASRNSLYVEENDVLFKKITKPQLEKLFHAPHYEYYPGQEE